MTRKLSHSMQTTLAADTAPPPRAPMLHTDVVGIVGAKGLFWTQDFITSLSPESLPRPARISIKSSAGQSKSSQSTTGSTMLYLMDEMGKWNGSPTKTATSTIAVASILQAQKCDNSRYCPPIRDTMASITHSDLAKLCVVGQVDCMFIACILPNIDGYACVSSLF